MSLSSRPHPITTHGKTTNIYMLVTFRTDSWRHPWGGHHAFTLLVIGWPIFPPSSTWLAQAIRFSLAHWSFPCSHLLGCGFLLSSSHSRLSSLEAWTSSLTSLACFSFARRHLSRRPSEEECPPSALGHPATSTTRLLRSTLSPRWAQTLL